MRDRAPGFSLIELTVVLVIIGVGTGLVVPMIESGINAREVRRAAVEIASTFHYCRNEAVALGKAQLVVIDPVRNSIYLGDRSRWAVLTQRAVIEHVEGDGSPVDGAVRILCYPNGATSGASVVLASRADRSRERLRVRLDPLLGRVDVTDAG